MIILRTLAPLPEFVTPFPAPPSTSEVSVLKLSILRILTGQQGSKHAETLTYSEQIKQMTIQGWRLKMLELVQVQSGTTEDAAVAGNADVGLVLQDDHHCSALENGDMVLVRIMQGYSLEELELPDLGPDYDYTASIESTGADLYKPPKYSLSRPSEPSSHSSSVQANPDGNFHAFRYPDYRQGYRVVTAAGMSNGVGRRAPGTGFGPGVVLTENAAAAAKQSHKLATLTSLARSSGPAGALAREQLAAMDPAAAQRAAAVAARGTHGAAADATEAKAAAKHTAPRREKAAARMPNTALVIGPGVQGTVGHRVGTAPRKASAPANVARASHPTAQHVSSDQRSGHRTPRKASKAHLRPLQEPKLVVPNAPRRVTEPDPVPASPRADEEPKRGASKREAPKVESPEPESPKPVAQEDRAQQRSTRTSSNTHSTKSPPQRSVIQRQYATHGSDFSAYLSAVQQQGSARSGAAKLLMPMSASGVNSIVGSRAPQAAPARAGTLHGEEKHKPRRKPRTSAAAAQAAAPLRPPPEARLQPGSQPVPRAPRPEHPQGHGRSRADALRLLFSSSLRDATERPRAPAGAPAEQHAPSPKAEQALSPPASVGRAPEAVQPLEDTPPLYPVTAPHAPTERVPAFPSGATLRPVGPDSVHAEPPRPPGVRAVVREYIPELEPGAAEAARAEPRGQRFVPWSSSLGDWSSRLESVRAAVGKHREEWGRAVSRGTSQMMRPAAAETDPEEPVAGQVEDRFNPAGDQVAEPRTETGPAQPATQAARRDSPLPESGTEPAPPAYISAPVPQERPAPDPADISSGTTFTATPNTSTGMPSYAKGWGGKLPPRATSSRPSLPRKPPPAVPHTADAPPPRVDMEPQTEAMAAAPAVPAAAAPAVPAAAAASEVPSAATPETGSAAASGAEATAPSSALTPAEDEEEEQHMFDAVDRASDLASDTPAEDAPAEDMPTNAAEAAAEPTAAQRADERFLQVQKELAAERARQDRAERARVQEIARRQARRAEAAATAAREKPSQDTARDLDEQWTIYEEVCRRQRELGLPPPLLQGTLHPSIMTEKDT